MQIFDIFLLEAIINGILLGGVLALLALGLNLIFGVIDVVWISYAEMVMAGMYTIYWGTNLFGTSLVAIVGSSLVAIVVVAVLGTLVHRLLISPIIDTAPINQLLVTGGLLFFLQSFATLLFGAEFRNLGLRLPVLNVFEMYISFARLLAFGTAIIGMIGLYLFLTRTYFGTAIRAIAQDREIMILMGVDTKKVYLITSAIGGGLAGLAALLLSLQYDVHPFIGLTFGPITFMVCVLGGLGNMPGGFLAAFIMSQFISIGGLYFSIEIAYVSAFVFFIIMIFIRPEGILRR